MRKINLYKTISKSKDQKQMWKKIKELVFNKKQNVVQSVIFNQLEFQENYLIANQFNNYFFDSKFIGTRAICKSNRCYKYKI